MSFDVRQQPNQVDDNWLSQAIIAKLGKENLLNDGNNTYQFKKGWQLLGKVDLKNLVREQIALLNELRAAANLKTTPINANRVGSVSTLLAMQIVKSDLQLNGGDPNTVGCANGDVVLNKQTWELHRPRNEDYRICRIPHLFDPDATAPRFETFLDEVFQPDPDAADKKELLLQMMGYGLMAHCQYERFLIAVGSGANGKSVAFNVMGNLAGARNTAAVHPALFSNNHHRAQLDQKLLNIITESEQGGKLPAAELKALVSGEMMTVDRKFQDPYEMIPMATIFWATNHMPHPSDYSDAVFRRAGILTFNRTFSLQERDAQLQTKLQKEMSGILNLALQAYARAVTVGFVEPASSKAAKDEWRVQSDAVALWLSECEMADGASLGVKHCYDAFRTWANSAGVKQIPALKTFSQRVERLRIQKTKTSQGMVFDGIKVAAA